MEFKTIKRSPVIPLLFAATFFISGIIISITQCFLYAGIRPFSKYFYRKINYYFFYSIISRKYSRNSMNI